MRYLVDECLGSLLVTALRDKGHDVEWVGETASGATDEDLLAQSFRDERVLLSADFDYGELIFGRGQPAYGVVVLQLSDFHGRWTEVAVAVVDRLETIQDELAGSFVVIGGSRVKMRALPAR